MEYSLQGLVKFVVENVDKMKSIQDDQNGVNRTVIQCISEINKRFEIQNLRFREIEKRLEEYEKRR